MIITMLLVARKLVNLCNPTVGIFQHTHLNVSYDTCQNNYLMLTCKNCKWQIR